MVFVLIDKKAKDEDMGICPSKTLCVYCDLCAHLVLLKMYKVAWFSNGIGPICHGSDISQKHEIYSGKYLIKLGRIRCLNPSTY